MRSTTPAATEAEEIFLSLTWGSGSSLFTREEEEGDDEEVAEVASVLLELLAPLRLPLRSFLPEVAALTSSREGLGESMDRLLAEGLGWVATGGMATEASALIPSPSAPVLSSSISATAVLVTAFRDAMISNPPPLAENRKRKRKKKKEKEEEKERE